MRRTKRKMPVRNSKRFKWWIKNNYKFLIIIGVVCLIVTLILVHEVYQFGRTRNMELLLNKSWREIYHGQGGFSLQDIETLKRRYPNVNWEDTTTGQHRYTTEERRRESRRRAGAKKKLRKRKE